MNDEEEGIALLPRGNGGRGDPPGGAAAATERAAGAKSGQKGHARQQPQRPPHQGRSSAFWRLLLLARADGWLLAGGCASLVGGGLADLATPQFQASCLINTTKAFLYNVITSGGDLLYREESKLGIKWPPRGIYSKIILMYCHLSLKKRAVWARLS